MTASLLALDRAERANHEQDAKRLIREARATITQATERTRRLTFELRPAVLHEQGWQRPWRPSSPRSATSSARVSR